MRYVYHCKACLDGPYMTWMVTDFLFRACNGHGWIPCVLIIKKPITSVNARIWRKESALTIRISQQNQQSDGTTLSQRRKRTEIQEKKLVLLISNTKERRLIGSTTMKLRNFIQTTWFGRKYIAQFIEVLANPGLFNH